MFRNVRFFRLESAWPDSEEQLNQALSTVAFRPCGSLTEKSSGWEAPVETPDGLLCRRVGGADLIQLRTQTRLLPAAVIREAVDARLQAYRDRTGELPGVRERRRMRLETRDELMPRALLRSHRMRAFFMAEERVLALDASSPARVEAFLEVLRSSLQVLNTQPLEFRRPTGDLLLRIFNGDGPPGIVIGRECRMQDPGQDRASLRIADMDLGETSIRRHVRDGMRLTHLAIEFDHVMSCVLDEHGGVGKLRLAGDEDDPAYDGDDPLARFDAQFVLLTGTLRAFLAVVAKAQG